MPRIGIARGGLLVQQVVQVGAMHRIAIGQRHGHHGHQPHRDGGKEQESAAQPAQCIAMSGIGDALPTLAAHQRIGNERKQRQEAHALQDHPRASG